MDYYHQIFCRFRKCKRKVPPPSPLSIQKSPFTPPKEDFSHDLAIVQLYFFNLLNVSFRQFCTTVSNFQKFFRPLKL